MLVVIHNILVCNWDNHSVVQICFCKCIVGTPKVAYAQIEGLTSVPSLNGIHSRKDKR